MDDCGRKVALRLDAADGGYEVECALVWIAFGLGCYCNPRVQEAMKALWPEELGKAPMKGGMSRTYYMPDLRYPKGDLRKYVLSVRLSSVDKIAEVAPAYALNAVLWIQKLPWQFREDRSKCEPESQAPKPLKATDTNKIIPPGVRPGRSWRDAGGHIVREGLGSPACAPPAGSQLEPGTIVNDAEESQMPTIAEEWVNGSTSDVCCTSDNVEISAESMEHQHGLQSCTEASKPQKATSTNKITLPGARPGRSWRDAEGHIVCEGMGPSAWAPPAGSLPEPCIVENDAEEPRMPTITEEWRVSGSSSDICCAADDVEVSSELMECKHGSQSIIEPDRPVGFEIAGMSSGAQDAMPKMRCAACAIELPWNIAMWSDYAQQYACCVICVRFLECRTHADGGFHM